jgi:hypothetical protein
MEGTGIVIFGKIMQIRCRTLWMHAGLNYVIELAVFCSQYFYTEQGARVNEMLVLGVQNLRIVNGYGQHR